MPASNYEYSPLKTDKKSSNRFTKLLTTIFLLFLLSFLKIFPQNKFFALDTKEKTIFEKEQAFLKSLITDYNISQTELSDLIHEEYGTYTDDLLSNEVLNKYFNPSPQFEERLIRKYQMKILSSYFYNKKNPFVWTTAGHSAAAGHGNLFNQTFTSIIDATVSSVFESIGLKFEARNYAMGGFGSFPELALCMESVYGGDVDMLSWDFGMTDAGPEFTLAGIDLWGNRARLLPSNPLTFGFGSDGDRIRKFLSFNGTLALNYDSMNTIRRNVIPDATKFLDPESLPLSLRNYNCKGHFESSDPCSESKFDTDRFCEKVDGQVSWHPGWKEHQFIGRIIGLYLTSFLEKALYQLQESTNRTISDTETITIPHFSLTYLQHLQEQELNDRSNFLATTPDTNYFQHYLPDEKLTKDLFRNHILCHSSLLPSEIRYKHILESPLNEDSAKTPFNVGINQRSYGSSSLSYSNPEDLTLVYDPEERDREKCDLPTRIDFKDRFFIGMEQPTVSFTLPTDNELKAYKHNIPTESTKVIIIVSHFRCDWGNCPGDYITVEEMLPADDGRRKLEDEDGDAEYDDEEGDDDEYEDEEDDEEYDDDNAEGEVEDTEYDDDVEDEEYDDHNVKGETNDVEEDVDAEFDDDEEDDDAHDDDDAEDDNSQTDNTDDETDDTTYGGYYHDSENNLGQSSNEIDETNIKGVDEGTFEENSNANDDETESNMEDNQKNVEDDIEGDEDHESNGTGENNEKVEEQITASPTEPPANPPTEPPANLPTDSPTLSPTITPYTQHGSISVNNEPVTKVTRIRDGYNVFILENKNGPYWDYSPEEKLNFRVRMYTSGKHLYITSFIMDFE